MSAFSTMFHGAPDFFTPRPFPPFSSAADSPEQVSYYDTAPLKATLGAAGRFRSDQREADALLGRRHQRAHRRAACTSRISNETLSAAHVMASASLPPGFPPTEIDGEYYLGRRRRLEFADAVRDRRPRGATRRWFFRSISGTQTAKCRSTFHRPICAPWRSTAPAASTSRSSNTERRRNSACGGEISQ